MNSNKKSIKSYLKKRNVKRFSIFIGIAFVFLIFSKLSNDYKQTIRLKVQLSNIADEIIISEDSVNVIETYINAKGFTLIPFLFKTYETLQLDASSDVSIQKNQFIFDVHKHRYLIEDQLGSSFKILSVKPDTLFLNYTKRASKQLPVKLNTDISFEAGYDILGDYNFTDDSVKVVGPIEIIDDLKEINTQTLVLSNVKSDIDQNLSFDLPDGIEVYPKTINVAANVKRFTEGTKEVPLSIINKPEKANINYFPKSVTIVYYVDLDNYKTIKASDFKVECDFDLISDDQPFLVPKIVHQPKFVKRLHIKQKRIDYIKL